MRVLLVHPEFPITYWGFQYSLPLVDKRATLPPLGLITLAALLPERWTLRLVDMNVRALRDEDLLWADAVLVGGMLVQVPSMHEVIARARRLGRRTIVGGPACTTSPSLFEAADHVFLGEAEGRTGAVVRAVERPEGAPHVLESIPVERPELTSLPVPRYDLLDLGAYRSMSVQYSRGCPFGCEFCDIVEIFGRTPRVKPAGRVLAELERLFALGYRGPLFFVDDNFIGNKRAVRALLPEVARWQSARGWPFSLYTEASVNLASDDALLRAMVEAGFDSVFLGIETPSHEALRAARKRQNVGVDLTAAIDTITRAGIEVMGGFIVGFDADDAASFDLQHAFIDASPIPLAMVGLLTALPGTALWRRLEREGRLRETSGGDQFGRPNFVPAMGEGALLAGYAGLLERLYSAEGHFRRVERLVDRIGRTARGRRIGREDLSIAARAVVRLGVLGARRGHFWRVVLRALRRGTYAVKIAITHAVMAEHMIRYTSEHVLPRIRGALAEVQRGAGSSSSRLEASAMEEPNPVLAPCEGAPAF
jgi:radical SAM superfamily enzyme YgiQ (UPF0313 family)